MPRKDSDLLDRLSVTAPCSEDWSSMSGNDQVRFCSHCDLSVHNLAEMTRAEALALVRKSGGRLCVRYYRRPDGRLHTATENLHSIRRRASRIAAGAFTATLSLCSSLSSAQTPAPVAPSRVTIVQPLEASDSARPEPQDGFTAALSGTITDPQGAVVPGVKLTLIDEKSKQEQSINTDDEGAFRFQALAASTYSLNMEVPPGFAAHQIKEISLRAGEELRVDTTLELDTTTATMGFVILVEPSNALVKAAFKDDLAAVRELIANGADVNVKDEDIDTTALMQAVGNGNHEMVRLLLDSGAHVNARTGSGQTALMMTGEHTTPEIIWTLISAGAKVNRRDDSGTTALMLATPSNNARVLRALLDAGAKVNAKNEEGKTALMWAAEIGAIENVRVLLVAGAEVNRKNDAGETALSLARENEHFEIVKLLDAYGAR